MGLLKQVSYLGLSFLPALPFALIFTFLHIQVVLDRFLAVIFELIFVLQQVFSLAILRPLLGQPNHGWPEVSLHLPA